MKKAVFFDIDGTLLGPRNGNLFSIPESALDAIVELERKGYMTAICTGRQKPFIQKFFPMFQSCIAMNGTYISVRGETVYEHHCPTEQVLEIMSHFDAYGACYSFVGNSHSWSRNLNAEQRAKLVRVYSLDDYLVTDWKPEDVRAGAMDFLFLDSDHYHRCLPAFTDGMVLNLHGSGLSGDMSLPGFDKARAIRLFCEHTGIDLKDTIAFGDGYNDVTMLETVGLGIAMGNAVPPAKQAADYVTDSLFDDGVAKAIRSLLL